MRPSSDHLAVRQDTVAFDPDLSCDGRKALFTSSHVPSWPLEIRVPFRPESSTIVLATRRFIRGSSNYEVSIAATDELVAGLMTQSQVLAPN